MEDILFRGVWKLHCEYQEDPYKLLFYLHSIIREYQSPFGRGIPSLVQEAPFQPPSIFCVHWILVLFGSVIFVYNFSLGFCIVSWVLSYIGTRLASPLVSSSFEACDTILMLWTILQTCHQHLPVMLGEINQPLRVILGEKTHSLWVILALSIQPFLLTLETCCQTLLVILGVRNQPLWVMLGVKVQSLW